MHRSLDKVARGVVEYGRNLLESANIDLRATLLHGEYRARREHYEERARQLDLQYAEDAVKERTQGRLAKSGLRPRLRPRGSIHTLAFFPLNSWHPQLVKPLAAFGPVSHFDSRRFGADQSLPLPGVPAEVNHRRRLCESFERFAIRVAAKRPVDWIFTYATGADLLAGTIDRVRELTRAPVVGMCFDDKQSWEGEVVGNQKSGQVSLASHFDLAWTSARVACEWYMVEGGNPIYLPEACDPDLYSPADSRQDFDLCFVGQAYGFRQRFIQGLRNLGLSIHTAGAGWPAGAVGDDVVVDLYRRSKIVLGLGGIGWSEDLKNTKGRDFDAPAVGMAPYLTSFNPELAALFEIGREIVCFSTADECYEMALRLLKEEQMRLAIARAGRDRCLREHTWERRFERILDVLGILGI
jgi:glycosyltransferase involved in cell wall biosynthesis